MPTGRPTRTIRRQRRRSESHLLIHQGGIRHGRASPPFGPRSATPLWLLPLRFLGQESQPVARGTGLCLQHIRFERRWRAGWRLCRRLGRRVQGPTLPLSTPRVMPRRTAAVRGRKGRPAPVRTDGALNKRKCCLRLQTIQIVDHGFLRRGTPTRAVWRARVNRTLRDPGFRTTSLTGLRRRIGRKKAQEQELEKILCLGIGVMAIAQDSPHLNVEICIMLS